MFDASRLSSPLTQTPLSRRDFLRSPTGEGLLGGGFVVRRVRRGQQLTHFAEQFAECAWRFVLGFFVHGVAHQLAKLLPVGRGEFLQQRGQRVVAIGQQAVAPLFGLVQQGGFATRCFA